MSVKHKHGCVQVRTWWFDRQLKEALERAAAAQNPTGGSGSGKRQVVLLGAGMDTRAWRLDFLEGGIARTSMILQQQACSIPVVAAKPSAGQHNHLDAHARSGAVAK